MNLHELRVEAVRAVASVTKPNDDVFGNLLCRAQTLYEWLRTGKDPIAEEAKEPKKN